MDSKYTPAPWTVRSNEPLVDSPYSIMAGLLHIGTVSWNMQLGAVQQKTEVEANAKLISAAPELLAALKLAKTSLKELSKEAYDHTSVSVEIQSAIDKATL